MKLLLVLGLLAASVMAAPAVAGSVGDHCLADCNAGMTQCLASCPAQCPVDPDCMKTCFNQCTLEERDCASHCSAPVHSPFIDAAQVKPAALSEEQYQNHFSQFVRKYNKKYPTDEFFARYAIFKANYNFVRTHTLEKQRTYTVAINEFADMTFSEFHAKMTGVVPRDNAVLRSSNTDGPHLDVQSVDASVDWRTKNAVTDVKNQQQCGSCWAFSTTGSTEGAHAIKTGDLVSLSEQQLVDCSAAQGNNGCNGGLMDQGFQYIISNKGVTTEEAYPYTAAQGDCKPNQKSAATLSSFVNVAQNDEKDLMKAVNVGPVSIAIEADQQCFQFYSGGVLSDSSCGTQLDHGVLVVGYGTDATSNQDYWIVKNSWGATWGESGYIRLVRGSNECGVAAMASYPVV